MQNYSKNDRVRRSKKTIDFGFFFPGTSIPLLIFANLDKAPNF